MTPRGVSPSVVTSLLLCSLLACDGGLEAGARGEARHSRRSDLDFGAGLGIAAGARSALGRLEGAESDEGHGITFRDGFDDSVEDGIKRSSSGGLADVCFGCCDFDQFGFVHEYPLGWLRELDSTD